MDRLAERVVEEGEYIGFGSVSEMRQEERRSKKYWYSNSGSQLGGPASDCRCHVVMHDLPKTSCQEFIDGRVRIERHPIAIVERVRQSTSSLSSCRPVEWGAIDR